MAARYVYSFGKATLLGSYFTRVVQVMSLGQL